MHFTILTILVSFTTVTRCKITDHDSREMFSLLTVFENIAPATNVNQTGTSDFVGLLLG